MTDAIELDDEPMFSEEVEAQLESKSERRRKRSDLALAIHSDARFLIRGLDIVGMDEVMKQVVNILEMFQEYEDLTHELETEEMNESLERSQNATKALIAGTYAGMATAYRETGADDRAEFAKGIALSFCPEDVKTKVKKQDQEPDSESEQETEKQ